MTSVYSALWHGWTNRREVPCLSVWLAVCERPRECSLITVLDLGMLVHDPLTGVTGKRVGHLHRARQSFVGTAD